MSRPHLIKHIRFRCNCRTISHCARRVLSPRHAQPTNLFRREERYFITVTFLRRHICSIYIVVTMRDLQIRTFGNSSSVLEAVPKWVEPNVIHRRVCYRKMNCKSLCMYRVIFRSYHCTCSCYFRAKMRNKTRSIESTFLRC